MTQYKRRRVIRRKYSKRSTDESLTSPTNFDRSSTHDHILDLQNTIGNQAVMRMIGSNQGQDNQLQRTSDNSFSLNSFKMAQAEVQDKASEGHGKGCGCASCSGGYVQRSHDDTISIEDMQNAQNEVQDKAPEGHGKGCGCASCSGGFVQRTPMQNITQSNQPQIQRDIISDWDTRSKSFWTTGRSAELKAIDLAVKNYKEDGSYTMGGLWKNKLQLLPLILDAIGGWKASKGMKALSGKKAKRLTAVNELEEKIKTDLSEVQEKKRLEDEKRARAEPIFEKWMKLSGGMDEFAKRNMFNEFDNEAMNRFDPEQISGRMKALNMYRNEDGSLSEKGIEENDKMDTESLKDKNLDIGSKAVLKAAEGLTKEQLIELRDKHLNPVTGKTIYPELNNLIEDDTGETDEEVTETKDIGGISFKVTYNKSDVNFDARFKMLSDAVTKIKSAGFTPPSLEVYLPKMGRSLTISGECEISEGKSKTERAVFVAPNFMNISSENMNNPLGDKKSGDPKTYKFSSTTYDPSGVGTIIHEFGHAMHRANDGGKFHELWGSGFKNKQMVKIANDQVSEYGTKPREFVAEVFLGMVYGKEYSEDVMKMYRAFGGAPKA